MFSNIFLPTKSIQNQKFATFLHVQRNSRASRNKLTTNSAKISAYLPIFANFKTCTTHTFPLRKCQKLSFCFALGTVLASHILLCSSFMLLRFMLPTPLACANGWKVGGRRAVKTFECQCCQFGSALSTCSRAMFLK